MIRMLYSSVSNGEIDYVKKVFRRVVALDANGSAEVADTGVVRGAVLTHLERTNLFATTGALFEFAVRRGDKDILTFLTTHFVSHFSLRQRECNDSDDDSDDDDTFDEDVDAKPIPPTSYSRMRRNFNNVLFNWRDAASNSNVKPIVDAFRLYFAGEEGPPTEAQIHQIFSQVCTTQI